MGVEPVPDAPAAVADTDTGRALVVADYHAGIETVLRSDGVELDPQDDLRRNQLLGLLSQTSPDRLVILGDLAHAIGDPWETERDELDALFSAISVPVTLVKGNHDGDIEPVLADYDVTVTPPSGIRAGDVGFVHGHTWPSEDVLESELVCMGHEHPVVRLTDSVGGYRLERVWLRGDLDPTVFEEYYGRDLGIDGELVVFPAFNDLSGGTWVNVPGQEFLSPFLPDGLAGGQAYLLDGTRLGDYRAIGNGQ